MLLAVLFFKIFRQDNGGGYMTTSSQMAAPRRWSDLVRKQLASTTLDRLRLPRAAGLGRDGVRPTDLPPPLSTASQPTCRSTRLAQAKQKRGRTSAMSHFFFCQPLSSAATASMSIWDHLSTKLYIFKHSCQLRLWISPASKSSALSV